MYISVKPDERKAYEAMVAKSFGIESDADSEQREAVEVIAIRAQEAYTKGREMER